MSELRVRGGQGISASCPGLPPRAPLDLSSRDMEFPAQQLPDPAALNGPWNFKHALSGAQSHSDHHPRILKGHTATPPLASVAARTVSFGFQLSELIRSAVNAPPRGLPSPF